MNCPICGQDEKHLMYVGKAPVACTNMPSTAVEAISREMLPLSMVCCLNCHHVYNEDMQEIDYDSYPMYNGGWSKHVEDQAKMLADLSECEWCVDIGGGDGGFLELLAKYSGYSNYHIIDPNGKSPLFDVHPEYSDELIHKLAPEVVIMRHTLEHFLNPFEVLNNIVCNVYKGTKFFIEVPNVEMTVERKWFADYMPEHPQNFSRDSLRTLIYMAGLSIKMLTVSNKGTVLSALAEKTGNRDWHSSPYDFPALEGFNFQRIRNELITLLKDQTIQVWGAGGKGATFLNVMKLNRHTVFDSDPRKTWKYVPGTAQRILGIEQLPLDCSKIFVTAPWRATDIRRALSKKLGREITVYTYSNDKIGVV